MLKPLLVAEGKKYAIVQYDNEAAILYGVWIEEQISWQVSVLPPGGKDLGGIDLAENVAWPS